MTDTETETASRGYRDESGIEPGLAVDVEARLSAGSPSPPAEHATARGATRHEGPG